MNTKRAPVNTEGAAPRKRCCLRSIHFAKAPARLEEPKI
jgi:hypothetical protein